MTERPWPGRTGHVHLSYYRSVRAWCFASMVRPLTQILANGKYAIAQEGIPDLLAQMVVQMRVHTDRISMAPGPDGPRSDTWESWLVKKYGHAHYYITPTGEVVHSEDRDQHHKLVPGTVAVVPVRGTIVRAAAPTEEVFYHVTSSKRIETLMRDLAEDPRISGVVLDVHSPGGQVYGVERAANAIAAANEVKPVVTFVNYMACSAAYWYASQSRTILLNGQTSDVGSVGVVTAWMDLIPLLEQFGAKYRMHFAPESVKKWEEYREIREKGTGKLLEEGMSPTAQMFQATVRAGRGNRLSRTDEAVLQGRVYGGDNAIAAGLADGYGTLEEAVENVRQNSPIKPTRSAAPKTSAHTEEATQTAAMNTIKSRIEAFAMRVLGANAQDDVKKDAQALAADARAVEQAAAEATQRAERAEAELATLKERITKAEGQVATLTSERDEAIAARDTAIAARDEAISERDAAATARDEASAKADAAEQRARQLQVDLEKANSTIAQMEKEHGTDNKPSRVVSQEGDVSEAAATEEIPGDKAFRDANLEEYTY